MNIDFKSIRTIVTHARCPDGMASAIILAFAFEEFVERVAVTEKTIGDYREFVDEAGIPIVDANGNTSVVEVKFLAYGTKEYEELPATPGMLFCDIAPPHARAQEFVDAGAYVLDHHGTAKHIVAMFGERGCFADEVEHPGVSGAYLAWREVWCELASHQEDRSMSNRSIHELAELAGIRDTWQKTSPRWGEACAQAAALMFHPFEKWMSVNPWRDEWSAMMAVGDILQANREESVNHALKRAYRTKVWLLDTCILQGTHVISDAADASGAALTAAFSFSVEDDLVHMNVSLRADGGVNVGAIAKVYGGGGHKNAAGFTLKGDAIPTWCRNPYEQVVKLLWDAIDKLNPPNTDRNEEVR